MNDPCVSVYESLRKYILANISNYYPDLHHKEVYLSSRKRIKKGRRSFLCEFEIFPTSQVSKKRVVLVKIPKKVNTKEISDAILCSESIKKARDEYKTLCKIFSFVSKSNPENLGAIRPFDYVPEFNAIIIEKIQGINLLDVITRFNIVLSKRENKKEQLKYYMQSSAELLRLLHSIGLVNSTKLSYDFDEYISSINIVMRKLQDRGINQEFLSFVKNLLAEAIHSYSINYNQYQLTQLHGDYQIKNILISNGKVYCSDMGLQKVGLIYEDIARFIISLKFTNTLMAFKGILLNDKLVQMLQNEFLLSYFQNRSYSISLLKPFLVKAIFQKWNRASHVENAHNLSSLMKKIALKLVINPIFQKEILNTLRI
jgi:tRNA A-37 threonylcarbamoyl transferase component Bud32